MSLRSKLLIPYLMSLGIVYGVVHFYWMPQMLEDEYSNNISREHAVIKALEPIVIRDFLSGNFADMYATMNINREANPHWVYLTLKDNAGKKLYPLSETSMPEGDFLIHINHKIELGGDSFGEITLITSWEKARKRYISRTNSIEVLMFLIFGIVLFGTAFWQTFWIRNPILSLKRVAQKLAEGDFKAHLPAAGKDELGQLTRSFQKMRDDLLQTQIRLKETIINSEASKDAAEKANLAKSEFLSRMSHELRTPMNAILGFTQILQMDSKGSTDLHKENLERISSAGHHLLDLINEVLDLSKIESGNMELSIETVDIVPLVDNVVSTLKPLAKEKNISLEYQEIPDGSYFAEVDSLRFKQVVLNLVSNAIKYNKPNGSVVLTCEKQGNDMARIGVRDTGHGISQDKQNKLFKPFERFDIDAEKIEGTGIGLTISKQLIEMMNGTIGFKSEAGEGSYFYIDVSVSDKSPLTVQTAERLEPTELVSLRGDQKNILYVEDMPANVELVRQVLKGRQDLRLLIANNALAGIELAKSETPELILMDIHMPGMDGLTAFRKLQTIKETKDIPVIALTADAMDGDIKTALDNGFKDYITKPIDITKFMKAIDMVLG